MARLRNERAEMILRKVIDLWKPRCGYYEPGSFDVQYELTKKV